MAASRQASVSRKTSETEIEVFIDLDCTPGSNVKQTIEVSTGIGFLDHVRSLVHLINARIYIPSTRCIPPSQSTVACP